MPVEPDQPILSSPYQGLARYRMFIGGEWVDARSGAVFSSIDPTTGQPWAVVPDGGAEDIDAAVAAARAAFDNGWRDASAAERAAVLRRLGDTLASPDWIQRLAVHEVLDTGKVIREAMGLARAYHSWAYYFAGLAEANSGEVIPVPMKDTFAYTVREPVGVVGAITPWNSPILLTLWKLAPALAAGNTIVVKPSEVAPASTLEFAKAIEAAGVPAGVVNVVSGQREAGAALASHPGIDKIAFTGSTATGRKIMHAAADNLKRVSLELGGKSPNVVFADSDLELAVNGIVSGGYAATGQMCTAGSRVLVERSIYREVLDALVERVSRITVGDPFDWDADMGALTWEDQYQGVLGHIATAKEQGARLVLGGGRPENPPTAHGYHVAPTIFADVRTDMTLAQQEIFGPITGLIPFDDEAEAIRIANDTPYGLAAAIWTNDLRRTHRLTKALHAGTVWVNCYRRVVYSSPFGGFKDSGLGKENGVEALHEYTRTKSVWVDTNPEPRDPFRLT